MNPSNSLTRSIRYFNLESSDFCSTAVYTFRHLLAVCSDVPQPWMKKNIFQQYSSQLQTSVAAMLASGSAEAAARTTRVLAVRSAGRGVAPAVARVRAPRCLRAPRRPRRASRRSSSQSSRSSRRSRSSGRFRSSRRSRSIPSRLKNNIRIMVFDPYFRFFSSKFLITSF